MAVRRSLAALVALLFMVCLSGCGGASSEAPSAGGAKKLRIAVIPKGTSHDFWYSVRAGVEKADAELDDVEVTWKGPVSEGDTSDQIKIIESFVADGYDGICLAPLDARALQQPVEAAMAEKVPVLIFDSALENDEGIVSYVATNNHRGGEVAGLRLAELLGGKGSVILMRYAINSQSTEEREQGFLDAIKQFPDIKILSADKYAGPDERGAIELSENLLANFGDQVNGIFCPNQSTASGMLTALRRDARGLAGKVKFVGFDAGDNIVDGLHKKEMQGAVLQDPVQMGYESVQTMVKHLRGEQVPKRIETREVLATDENVDDPTIQSLVHPESTD